MQNDVAKRIVSDPNYQLLKRKRSRLAWVLTLLTLVIYYGFIMIIAFSPKSLAIPLAGHTTTIGFPLGLGVILLSILLTGIYVVKANGEFEVLTQRIRDGVGA